MSVRILRGDCREVLKSLPDESVHCVVTSPPYFGLRDYGVAGQIGLEPTPDAYVAELVGVFREVRRVLRSDGVAWLNLGDSYAANRSYQISQSKHQAHDYGKSNASDVPDGLKPKDLIGIPWRVAFALQADGWWLRQDIIWAKPNPMPESVTDRCCKAHEYLFLLTKSATYFYDAQAIAEPFADERKGNPGSYKRTSSKAKGACNDRQDLGFLNNGDGWNADGNATSRNKRSVWTIATQPFSEAHFATFPPALIEPCILAGCPEKCCSNCGAPWVRETERNEVNQADNEVIKADGVPGLRAGTSHDRVRKLSGSTYQHVRGKTLGFSPSCSCHKAERTACIGVCDCTGAEPIYEFMVARGTVLDPFGGAGTTGLVADRLQRNAILVELNQAYAEMAERRIHNDAPLLMEAAE